MVICGLQIFQDHIGGRRKIFERVHDTEKKKGAYFGSDLEEKGYLLS